VQQEAAAAGYERVGTRRAHYLRPDGVVDAILMERLLHPP
jgi:hypothetical protein